MDARLLEPRDPDFARGRVVKPGRTVTVAERHTVAVADGTEELCATLTETMMLVTHHDERTHA